MKTLICIPCLLIGGTEIQTLNLVRALRECGHEVLILCYYEYDSYMVRRFEEMGSMVHCLSPDGIRMEGKSQIPFLYKEFKKILKIYLPDIVHVQYMAPGALPVLLFKILGVRNIIATLHTTAEIYKSTKLVRFIQKFCVRAFTCITLEAEKSFFGSSLLYTKDVVLKRHNHFTIYNALPDYICIKKDSKVRNTTITVGVVSRLEPIKGMDLVIPAFAEVLLLHPYIRLFVVGDGSLLDEMKADAEERNISNSISFFGEQPHEALPALYDQIDILLVPSRSEGFGLTAIEGMARGCVVVASNVGGLPEIVKNRQVGLLHEPDSIEDIVEKVNLLVCSQKRLKHLSENARAYVGKFCFIHYSHLFNDLYQKLYNRKRKN
ncbi:glycosyltransferase family 4 protein [Porphyromonas macacae]|uniref:glycosyltransferase family 4 protein n=1 Tax=Porphyromonas macacae TaxID=28115 RepID=UPI0024AE408D|nr:glycosyltransferase family 4 protein [Porphyromonas macacae]